MNLLEPDKSTLILYVCCVPDVFTKKKRSEVMSLIKSSGNRETELKFIAILRAHGIRGWRRKLPLPGKPDFVFPQVKIAVFIDGCFWHGCRWHCRLPKSRIDFWHPKIARNKVRDRKVNRILRNEGWRVIRLWEHSLNDYASVANRIQGMLASELQNV